MGFIPDLGVSKVEKDVETEAVTERKTPLTAADKEFSEPVRDTKPDKKVASYSLEAEVITRVKQVADETGMYYSTLVNKILKSWFREKH